MPYVRSPIDSGNLANANAANTSKAPRLYLEDIVTGQQFTSASRQITADEIKRYAQQFDPQPFHLDEEAAKSTFFGGLAASGWHTAGITMRLLVESGMPLAGGIIGAGGEITWPQATRPDDVLHVVTEVISVTPSRSRPDRGFIQARSQTFNQKGEVVQLLLAKLMVWSRSVKT
ncbi:MaoC family dehydratase [Glaciimonas immobilis]|uniref:Acyl dehydratase n=1 Tax=Glaciimonas immobilis TaxID=728004 RepID=A0A840RR64_9BURK|nr:MaoC family dehydratase [Glaciimonas immobilis]KAF3999464.1 MaoC family dehydratase [Glaciimonas immobilis]MBB5198979.1 acyl dehydratase [Glaciimonas immobilis]